MVDGGEIERFRIDKRRVRSSFNRAAPDYDQAAVLQGEVAQRLLERLELIRLEPATILDIGAGTGRLSTALSRRYPRAHIVSIDIAPAMLAVARRRRRLVTRWRGRQSFVCADAEALPLRAGCADLIVSNLTLQWCNEPDGTLAGFRRLLRPGGLLMFTTFGPDTLKELRASWEDADRYTHVNAFIDMHDIGDALLRAGLSDPVMDREDFTLTYADVNTLMRDLKAIGAHNVTAGRPRGLTGRRRLAHVAAAYESRRDQGRLPASYEVIYGHGWAPLHEPRRAGDGTIRVPLAEIGRRGERS